MGAMATAKAFQCCDGTHSTGHLMFTSPMPWTEGVRRLRARGLMPTTLGTEDIQKLGAGILRRAVFSAKVENMKALQKINDVITEVVRGISQSDEALRGQKPLQKSVADAKFEIRKTFRELGVEVKDSGDVGTMKDFQSDQRINLIVSTQEQMARGYGNFIAGQDEDILDIWPCQELVRVVDAQIERDWPARWKLVGGQMYDGRMIALKNSDIWDRLGDPAIFKDGLGNPYPPFAFNSGMRVEDVSRDEAEELGVIAKGTPPPSPRTRDIKEDAGASLDGFDEELRLALANEPGFALDGGILTLR